MSVCEVLRMMRWGRWVIGIWVWIALSGFLQPAFSQSGETSGWTTYANADQVRVLRAQGQTLWAGSEGGGLVEWDVNQKTFRSRLYPQDNLAGNTITNMTIASDGTLWVATTGGVSRYPPGQPGESLTIKNTSRRGDRKATVLERAATNTNMVRLAGFTDAAAVLAAFDPGYLMFGTDPTIYFYRDWDATAQAVVISPALHRTVEPGTPVFAVHVGLAADHVKDIVEDQNGRIWISTVNGVSVYEEGLWTVYTRFNSPLLSNDAGVMAVDGAGRVWISHQELGRFSMYDGNWHTFDISGNIRRLAINPADGQVWAATNQLCDPTGTCRGGGVWAFDGTRWQQRFQARDGIADDDVDKIAFGTGGRLWLGHSTAGKIAVSRWTGSGWRVYEHIDDAISAEYADILTTVTPNDMWAVAAGQIWTRHLGAVRGYAPDRGWTTLYTGATILNSNKTRTIAADEAGNIWVGTERGFDGVQQIGGGINQWDGQMWHHFTAENGSLADNLVSHIVVGRNRVWAETLRGFSRYANGMWEVQVGTDVKAMVEQDYWSIIEPLNSPPINENRLWMVDPENRVWVWGGDGAWYFRPDTGWVHYAFETTVQKRTPPVAVVLQRALLRETQILVSAIDIPDSRAAQQSFANGYLMIGDDPTVYRYESFRPHFREDAVVLQISPRLQSTVEVDTPIYAVSLGLLSNSVRDVTVGTDGRIWFATRPGRVGSTDVYGGISILDVAQGTWQNYSVWNTSQRGETVARVMAEVEVPAGNTRVPTDFPTAEAANQALASGFVMLGDDPTVYRYNGFIDGEILVKPIFSSSKYEVGLQEAIPAGAPIYQVRLGLLGTPKSDGWADRLVLDSSGGMWIAIQGLGISVLSALGEWTHYLPADDGLASAKVQGVLARGNEMWVWTAGGGISRFRDGAWRTFNVFNSGLVDNEVESLSITADGELWVATHAGGISVFALPGFRLQITPIQILVQPGNVIQKPVQVLAVGNFNQRVSLEVEGLPPGVTATFAPAVVEAPGTVVLTLDVMPWVPPGKYPITVVARSEDGLTVSKQVVLEVVSNLYTVRVPFVGR